MPSLKKNHLGNTGLYVSSIGLGTVKFGRNVGVKYPNSFEIPKDEELRNLLTVAWDHGINYLDTAPAYGTSEETLGRLKKLSTHEWIISTKVGEYFDQGVSHFDFSKRKTIDSIHNSLRKLGRHALDIVYVHSDGEDERIIRHSDVLPTLLDLKQKGDIRAIGFSGKKAEQSAQAIDDCDVFMVTLNEKDQSQKSLIDLCQARNKGIVIKKALASGHVSNPNDAIQFAMRFSGVQSVIVGTVNPAHLVENIQAAKGA